MSKLQIPKPEISIAMESGGLDMLTVSEHSTIEPNGIAWVRARIKVRCDENSIKCLVKLWRKFWVYFRRTWITLHPPAVWNVHGLRRDVVARTNNPLERFNRKINSAFSTPHPSTVRVVQTIEDISRRYVRLREEIARGIAAPPRRATQPDLPTLIVFPTPETTTTTKRTKEVMRAKVRTADSRTPARIVRPSRWSPTSALTL